MERNEVEPGSRPRSGDDDKRCACGLQWSTHKRLGSPLCHDDCFKELRHTEERRAEREDEADPPTASMLSPKQLAAEVEKQKRSGRRNARDEEPE